MRDLDVNVLDALDQDHIAMALLGEFEFADGTVNLWAGPEGHALSWDSKTWNAVGDIGRIDKIAEGQGLADSRTTLALRLNSDEYDFSDLTDSRGRAATLTLLLMSDEGTPIGPVEFRTTMGAVGIQAAASVDEHGRKVVDESITLELLNETASLGNSHFVRMTYEAGLRIDATDHGLEFVSDPDIGNLGLHTGGPRHRDRAGPRQRRRRS